MAQARTCAARVAGLPSDSADAKRVQCLLRLGLDQPHETDQSSGVGQRVPSVSDISTQSSAPEPLPSDPGPHSTIRVDIPLTEKPGDRICRYKLLEQIGEAGLGVLYVAEQEQPVRRRGSLKVIKLVLCR